MPGQVLKRDIKETRPPSKLVRSYSPPTRLKTVNILPVLNERNLFQIQASAESASPNGTSFNIVLLLNSVITWRLESSMWPRETRAWFWQVLALNFLCVLNAPVGI